MKRPLVVMDIGDVLISTQPMAQWRHLSHRLGIPWRNIAETIEASGIISAIETGRVSVEEFCIAVRSALQKFELGDSEIIYSWNSILKGVEPVMAAAARCCAETERLLLVSNTDPIHWQRIRNWLAGSQISAPAILSFEIGHSKPSIQFFKAAAHKDSRIPLDAFYIDDRMDNVTAAVDFGMTGWLHCDPGITSRRIGNLLS
jgi:FMN phosphatase YigB (HAD superfamily)